MRPTSISMCANKRLLPIGVLALLLLLGAAPVSAVDNLGGHFRDPEEFRQVIDLRCIGCHTRERIDAARKRQELLEPLTRRMVERGAVVTEQEREVLGAFWGTPLKEKKGSREDHP